MARPVNPEEHAAHRRNILAAAQTLVNSVGFDAMTVQDVIESARISKGAFYHYFPSKHALLDGLVEGMHTQVHDLLDPIVGHPEMDALTKLTMLFRASIQWKRQQMPFILGIMRVWYADSNAIVRCKAADRSIEIMVPLLTQIVRQGIREGTLHPEHPEQVACVLVSLLQGMGDAMARALLEGPLEDDDVETTIATVGAYTAAFEQLLGAPSGSIRLLEAETIREYAALIASERRDA